MLCGENMFEPTSEIAAISGAKYSQHGKCPNLNYSINVDDLTFFSSQNNIGQLVNNTVKAGQSKLDLADYRARTGAMDKGLKDLQVFF